MSELKTTDPALAALPHTPDSSEHPVDFNSYLRRCLYVFLAALCMIFLMVFASFAPIGSWTVKVTGIIAIASVNASVVAGFLMHLLSEKKTIYTVLAVTVIFFASLMGLTMWAMNNFPTGTAVH